MSSIFTLPCAIRYHFPIYNECFQVCHLARPLPDDQGAEDEGSAPTQRCWDKQHKVEQQGIDFCFTFFVGWIWAVCFRMRCQSSWGCHYMLWRITRKKKWRRTWQRRRCSGQMGWHQEEAPWARWGASAQCRTVGGGASPSWVGCLGGRGQGLGRSLEPGWVGRGMEHQRHGSTLITSIQSAGRDQWDSVYVFLARPTAPRAKYMNAVIIQVVNILFDPEIQSPSEYHARQDSAPGTYFY